MKLSIAQKLVLAFVGLTLLVLAATLGLARWSFEQGFLDYMNALEQTRLERVQVYLADEYVDAGHTWQTLTEQRFTELMRRSEPRRALRRSPPGAPPPLERNEGMHPPPPGGPEQQRRPAQQPLTVLYDTDENLVAGASSELDSDQVIRVPVIVDGKSVGELRSQPRRRITSPLETEFSRQQLKTSWLLGVSSLILAFGVSLLLARGLLAPVRRMIASVARLSSGDYSQRMNENRSDELGRLTEDIDRLGATLEANRSSRKRLLADVSHELRTPITVLAGEIEALKDGVREFNAAQLESLDHEVQRLHRLVDDLYELSISDMGGLRYQFAPVDITDCLDAAVDGMRSRAAALGIELTLEKPDVNSGTEVCVNADIQRVEQLLSNLLENSLAYTDSPGRVTVTLSRTRLSAVISIADTAPGVNASECEQLFDPLFRQEESRSRRTGGAGLGLAICRNIVTAHNGSITASPSTQGGLCIRVELPLSGEPRI